MSESQKNKLRVQNVRCDICNIIIKEKQTTCKQCLKQQEFIYLCCFGCYEMHYNFIHKNLSIR